MLQYIKKYIKGWFLGILLFFIFISFTFWGVGDIFRGSANHFIKIGKNKISFDFFQAEFQSNLNSLNKEQKKLNKLELKNLANETIRNIANRYLILNAANSININISEEILKNKILENKSFQNKLKKNSFDKNLYINFVNANFGSEKNYLEYLEDQIIVEMISNYFEEKIYYPKNLTNKIYNKLEEKKSFQIAYIDKFSQSSTIKVSDKESILEYFNNNKKKYLFDERRSFTYIFPNLNKIKKRIEINEEEILDAYNNQKGEFSIPEKRNVEQLVFANEKIGREILKTLNKESKFKQISEKEKVEEISYINLGSVEKKQLFNEFDDVVFDLKKDEFTDLIKTDIGWHILKVTEIIKSKSKELSDVKDIIKEELALNKSYDELDTVIIEVEKDISNGISLEEISNKLNLELNKKKLIEKKSFFTSDLPNEIKIDNFFNEVFQGKIESDLFIEEVDDGFFVVRIDEIIEEQPMNFEEAYNDVIKDIKKEIVAEQVNKLSKKFKKKLKEGMDFIEISDLLKMDNRTTKKFNREDIINQGFSLDFANKLFKSKINTIHENETNNKYYIVKVISDSEVKYNNEVFNEIERNINRIYGIDNFQQVSKILENKYPVSVNNNLLHDFIDRLEYK